MRRGKKARSQNEIIKELAVKCNLPLNQTKKIVDHFAEVITSDLKTYGLVNLPHLGKLKTHEKAAHLGRNPRTGKTVEVPAKVRVLFKAKKTLAENIGQRKTQAA